MKHLLLSMFAVLLICPRAVGEEITLLDEAPAEPRVLTAEPNADGRATWWLPADAASYTLPITAGLHVARDNKALQDWLIKHSPFHLLELPAFGGAYGDHALTIIAPWPHYAELVAERDEAGRFRVGVRFSFPEKRLGATPCEIVVVQSTPEPLAIAKAFRQWRKTAADLGGIPKQRTLTEKAEANPRIARLFGAPHVYLWGPALFSRHDVDRQRWIAFAKTLESAPADGSIGRLIETFNKTDRAALAELTNAEWPMVYLTRQVADAIDRGLRDRSWLNQPDDRPLIEVITANRTALAEAYPDLLNPPQTWGDALSTAIIDGLQDAGLDHALLLLSDLYADAPRPDIAKAEEDAGYLLGRYDSYHSVHDPDAGPDQTWATAQFDRVAYEDGRILNADGTGHRGFKGRGYHLAPRFALPYVQARVNAILGGMPQSAWFIDCDAAYEYFDDYRPGRSATRVDDVNARRERLRWLEEEHQLVVGSEGGSALFSDVIAYGQGVHTPYIDHLDPAFRDPDNASFLGKHWPPDAPGQSFDEVVAPASVISPFFDPTVRVPLYRAALGDQVVVTHHWSLDSFKLSNVEATRGLMELLYLAPPTYHLSRATLDGRKGRIAKHCAFWSPLHRRYAAAELIRYEVLSKDRLVQRTTYEFGKQRLTMTVNFDVRERLGLPAMSATADDSMNGQPVVYVTQHPATP